MVENGWAFHTLDCNTFPGGFCGLPPHSSTIPLGVASPREVHMNTPLGWQLGRFSRAFAKRATERTIKLSDPLQHCPGNCIYRR